MPGPYPSKGVANALLQRAFNDRKAIGHLKLQKLVYLSHGYYLALTKGTPLIDEPFEAWDYGPVCRNLYYEFRDCGRSPISHLATDLDWEAEQDLPVPAPQGDSDADKVIDFVYKTYIDRAAFTLSDLTHQPGWAWDVTRKADKFGLKNVDISNERIQNDFLPHIKPRAASNVGDR